MNLIESGVVWTTPKACSPLESLTLEYHWQGLHGQPVHLEVSDADHQVYLRRTIASENQKAVATILPAGKPGVHHIELWTVNPDKTEYRRHGCFRVTAATSIQTDNPDINDLFEQLQEALRQTLDLTMIDGRRVTQYKCADNTRQNLAYPAYAISALRYFIADTRTMFDVIFDYQYPNGSLPDHIYGDDYPCPLTSRRLRSCMADLEIGAAVTLCKGWQAHGDRKWISDILPKVEAALEYVLTDPATFDLKHGVIKRAHTLDEWDIHFTPEGEQSNFITENTLWVVMQGDTSCLYDACNCLAEVYDDLGNAPRGRRWRRMRDHFGKIGNALFWDGTKYLHHVHLDKFDHGDFDEASQLSMSNPWAITRGFASHEQAISIIKEYLRRWKQTGDRFPWWSLQPGYPDHLNYFSDREPWRKTQGYYCNGGLFPLVGGELCKAAFQHGMESVALTLLRDLHFVLKRDNGAIFTWYDLKGNAAINAPHNQTNYDGWGISPWMQAIVEELAGIRSHGKCFERVICSPRWPVTSCRKISACAHFPASDTHFSYRYEILDDRIEIQFAGTGSTVEFKILLPHGKECRQATIDGQTTAFDLLTIEASTYVVLNTTIAGHRELICRF